MNIKYFSLCFAIIATFNSSKNFSDDKNNQSQHHETTKDRVKKILQGRRNERAQQCPSALKKFHQKALALLTSFYNNVTKRPKTTSSNSNPMSSTSSSQHRAFTQFPREGSHVSEKSHIQEKSHINETGPIEESYFHPKMKSILDTFQAKRFFLFFGDKNKKN